jgi:hypothetical protein
MTREEFYRTLDEIKGKTIAIVYVFEADDAKGYKHYDAWKADVISDWLLSIQNLHCLPYILDLRTFVFKAMNNSLPPIDYVINLNNGSTDLSILGIVPSVCSFFNIPCIPCNTYSITIGEHKIASNLIAYAKNFNIPNELSLANPHGIFRPCNLGSSKGVQRGVPNDIPSEFIYQEFVDGFDITTPILYNPYSNTLEVLPAVCYIPTSKNTAWFLGDSEKSTHCGYKKVTVKLEDIAKNKFIELAKTFSIMTYCRIDCRLKCDNASLIDSIIEKPIPFDKLLFLEINPTPTIKENINFLNAVSSVDNTYSIFQTIEDFKTYQQNKYSNTTFVLACSIISLFKAKH